MQRLFLGKRGRQIAWVVKNEAQKLGCRSLDREWLHVIYIHIYIHIWEVQIIKKIKDLGVELKCLRTTTLTHMNKKKPLQSGSATKYTSQVHQVFLDSSTCIHRPCPLDMWPVSALEQGLGFCPVTLQCLSE